MTRTALVAALAGTLLVAGLGCSSRAPMAVRFSRQVDPERIAELRRREGNVVLLADTEFWTDQQRVGRIPIARRAKTFIVGPSAAAMAHQILEQMFYRVEQARVLERVEDIERFDYVVRLTHDGFDSTTLFLPLMTYQRFSVAVGAELSRTDGTPLGRATGSSADSFLMLSTAPENPFEGEGRIREKSSVSLNAAVQDALFELMGAIGQTLPTQLPEP